MLASLIQLCNCDFTDSVNFGINGCYTIREVAALLHNMCVVAIMHTLDLYCVPLSTQ